MAKVIQVRAGRLVAMTARELLAEARRCLVVGEVDQAAWFIRKARTARFQGELAKLGSRFPKRISWGV